MKLCRIMDIYYAKNTFNFGVDPTHGAEWSTFLISNILLEKAFSF